MKILFYEYGSICEPDLEEQFKTLNIEIDVIDVEKRDKKLKRSQQAILVSDMLNVNQYLFVFSINFFPAISDVCNIYGVKYLSWTVDSPILELFSNSIKNPCNRLFCFDKNQYETFKAFNPSGIFYLPLCTNVSRFDKELSSISKEDFKKYSCDISFVGNLYWEKDYIKDFSDKENILTLEKSKELFPNLYIGSLNQIEKTDSYIYENYILGMHKAHLDRVNMINSLSKDFSVDIFTSSETSELLKSSNLRIHPSVKTLTEMPKVFKLSKINLNMTIPQIKTGASLRIWDILGCGGFLLTDYREELSEYLCKGEDYESFSSLEELKDKCRFFLKNDSIREKIALSGYSKVKQYHTYINRMPKLFSSL